MNPQLADSVDFFKVDWSPHSFEDPGGRIFWKEGRLFRALRGRSAEAFLLMESEGLLEKIEQWGSVKTWRADLHIPGYEVVVEHEVIPPSPVVSEWSPSMLFDAALLYCDLSHALAEQGLQLQDSHGWNIMFHHTRPVYVDFTSIVLLRSDEPWMPLYEFINCFLHPLEMIAQQQGEHAFYLLGTRNWVPAESSTPYLFRLQHRVMKKLKKMKYQRWEHIRTAGGPDAAKKLAAILKQEIARCVPPSSRTRWSNYADGFPNPTKETMSKWNEKQKSIHRILSTLEKGRILDIGCNTGWYSILAAQMGFDVVSMDTDRTCIDRLYSKAKQEKLRITPVVASPFWPVISHGPRFYDSLERRFRSDHTLMLALIHWLFFKQGFDVDSIIAIAAKMTKKTLVLEYIPVTDYWVQNWNVSHRIDEYELDTWITKLKGTFSQVDILPSEYSHPSSPVQRLLLFAQR